jgi:hypothetical protein
VEQPPTIFDGCYEIVNDLGWGTTGTVYEAPHARRDRCSGALAPAFVAVRCAGAPRALTAGAFGEAVASHL